MYGLSNGTNSNDQSFLCNYAASRNICLEKEKKLAAQLIAQKAAQKQLTSRQKIGRTQATKKRHSSTTSISRDMIIGQKRKKVCYLFYTSRFRAVD